MQLIYEFWVGSFIQKEKKANKQTKILGVFVGGVEGMALERTIREVSWSKQ